MNLVTNKGLTLENRFDRNLMLIGSEKQEKLHQAHVMLFGIGGVGSYTAESLTRAGIGRLTLVDFDTVCFTNMNRQYHARKENIGKQKTEVMKDILLAINPELKIKTIPAFYGEENSSSFFEDFSPDFVIDAIDNLKSKVHLLKTCLERNIPIASSMGAGGRIDPTKIGVKSIWDTKGDPLAKLVRKRLRREKVKGDFPVVCSSELPAPAIRDPSREGAEQPGDAARGTISYITAIFGMTLSGIVVNKLLTGKLPGA